jgi:hypothetical protein
MDLFWTNMDYVGSDNSGFGIGMDLFWANMDYVGSDNSGLGSVWIYSGPLKPKARISGSPLVINPDQIILVWDRCGFILDQHGLRWIR